MAINHPNPRAQPGRRHQWFIAIKPKDCWCGGCGRVKSKGVGSVIQPVYTAHLKTVQVSRTRTV